MNAPRFFTDEDVYAAIASSLRKAGFDAVSAPEAGRLGLSDESQLTWAADEARVLVTFNVAHFAKLHGVWMRKGRGHAGLVVSNQRPIGDVLRRLMHLAETLDARDAQDAQAGLRTPRTRDHQVLDIRPRTWLNHARRPRDREHYDPNRSGHWKVERRLAATRRSAWRAWDNAHGLSVGSLRSSLEPRVVRAPNVKLPRASRGHLHREPGCRRGSHERETPTDKPWASEPFRNDGPGIGRILGATHRTALGALGANHQSIDIQNRDVPPAFDSEPHTTLVTAERSAAKLWLVSRFRQRRAHPDSITIAACKISILKLERCGAHRPVDGCQLDQPARSGDISSFRCPVRCWA